MVESTDQTYHETPTDEIVHLIILLESKRLLDPHRVAKLLFEIGQKASTEMLVDPAIGARL